MTKSRIITIALIVLLIALAVSAWFTFGTTAAGIEYADADQYTAGDAAVTGAVENLFIDWTSGRVNIEYHDGSEIFVSETAGKTLSEDDKLRWWLDGTTLRIRYAKSGFRISFNLNKSLTVSLPEGMVLKSADIGTTSGDIDIPDLAADEIRLDSTSGSIACTLADVKTLTASSTSGGIGVTVTGTAGTVRMHSTSGNLYPEIASADSVETASTSGSVTGSVASFTDLKVGSTSGSVTLKLPAEPGFTLKAGTTSGTFSSDLALSKNGDTYSCGDGSARCSINTTSGNIRIEPVR